MPKQEKHIEIGDNRYHLTQLGARQGRAIWLKLVKTIAAPMRAAAGAESLDEDTVMTALATLIENLDHEALEEMYEVFGEHCEVQIDEKWPKLKGIVFDDHFAGDYVAMSKWLGECLLFNYGSFLGDTSLGQLVARVQTTAKERLSRKASTGSSGASSPTSEPQ